MKIGIDIVQISRIEKSIQRKHFLQSVFTPDEIDYCKNAENFAGLFAAKEAYLKALGCGIDRRLNKIEIAHKDSGKPYLKNIENSDLSISHDGNYAVASVILY